MRLLHIENDVGILKAVARMLTRLFGPELEIVQRVDATGAIEQLAGDWDVVLCDMQLDDGTTGMQVYEWLVAHRPEQLSRFVFVTSHDMSHLHPRSLVKPVMPSVFVAEVRAVLEQRTGVATLQQGAA